MLASTFKHMYKVELIADAVEQDSLNEKKNIYKKDTQRQVHEYDKNGPKQEQKTKLYFQYTRFRRICKKVK